MMSDKQREFNIHMDKYLRKLPKKRKRRSKRVSLPKKKVKEETEVLEEKELERVDEEIGKQSFFSRLYDWIFGSRAKVVTEEDFGEEVEHIEEEPEVREKRRRSYIDSIMRALWGEKKTQEEYEESEPEIKKIVLIKPAVEQELKFVLKLMDSMLKNMSKRDRERFLQSREYKVYQKIRQKHG